MQPTTTTLEYPNHKLQNYKACMVLAAVGDAMGYKNGDWEFLTNGSIVHSQMMEMTKGKGPLALKITMEWRYSDDTVMHIATALGLINRDRDGKDKGKSRKGLSVDTIARNIAVEYKKCWSRMGGRAPGKTTGKSISILNEDGSNWNKIPYRDRSCGCGASMRSACIGLAFYDDIDKLLAVSIEAGRITHHNPVAYLGSVIAAYWTALAVKGVEPKMWVAWFLEEAVPKCEEYIKKCGREVKQNLGENWKKFIDSVKNYAQLRNISVKPSQPKQPKFPAEYGVVEREHFYHKISWGAWPGALGIDSVLIAYDAFLSSQGSWEELCLRGILHGGDNDSTGTIAGAWFGAYYAFKGVPAGHYEEVEDYSKLKILAQHIFNLE